MTAAKKSAVRLQNRIGEGSGLRARITADTSVQLIVVRKTIIMAVLSPSTTR